MMRRLFAAASLSLALTGCITYEYVQAPGPQYRDGSYYYPADDGYGDYYAEPHSPYERYDSDPYDRWFYGYGSGGGSAYWHPYYDRYGWFGGYGRDRCGYDWRGDWRCWDTRRGWRGSISYGRGWGWGSSWVIFSNPWPSYYGSYDRYGHYGNGYYGGGYGGGYYGGGWSHSRPSQPPRVQEPRPVTKPIPAPGSARPEFVTPIAGPRTEGEYARGGFPRSQPVAVEPEPTAQWRDKPQPSNPVDDAPPPNGMRYQVPSQRGEPAEPAFIGRAANRPRDLGRERFSDAQPIPKPQPVFESAPSVPPTPYEDAPRYSRPEPREQPRFERPEPRYERPEPRFERPEPREMPRFERPEPREEPRFERPEPRFERPEPREEPRFERAEPVFERPEREEREEREVE